MNIVSNPQLCTGCTACYSACPVHCIEMNVNEEGFLYPIIGDQCIHCGKCEKICPISNPPLQTKTGKQIAVAALTKKHDVWKRSASGGAFSEICKAFGDDKTIVCGAAWDEKNVHHACITGVDNIAPLCKSKYIESSLENVFHELKVYLDMGKKAIFCGTPCQVAGLKAFLNKDYDNLLLIDLICHGVGSPTVFKQCLSQMEKDLSGKILSYQFRSKGAVYDRDHIAAVQMKDQKKPFYITHDRYLQLFIEQHCLRPSCGKNCMYRNAARQGDIFHESIISG